MCERKTKTTKTDIEVISLLKVGNRLNSHQLFAGLAQLAHPSLDLQICYLTR